MMTEQEEIWDRLKYGIVRGDTDVIFCGDGHATKFNSGWVSGARIVCVSVDDVAQSNHRDFKIEHNTIIFKHPPAKGLKVIIKVYN